MDTEVKIFSTMNTTKIKSSLEVMKKKLKEEEKEAMEKVTVDTVREERHVAPAHYSMKIDSFSLLSEMVDNSYESREFEASATSGELNVYSFFFIKLSAL
uniref:Uncharacterized protein n=1 Tax=Salix viminalis TaxID=40686 RepID=A0A6N2LJI5_SALVM